MARSISGEFCPRCLGAIAFGASLEAPPELPASLGTLKYFGDYELLEEIARGGMGVVYRARQVNLDREVAVKLMLQGALASEADVERFRVEATAVASLRHPHIVAIHEIGEHEGQHYFSMDLVTGRNLDELTRSGPLAGRQAAELVAAVARAVDYAHRHGVLHRDIKPSNVIVDAEGQPHVTDFGLARRIADPGGLTLSGQILGTPGFMAPEQIAGDPQKIGVAADVYSLGAVLYQTLTGRPPFMGTNLIEVLRQVAESEPAAPTLLNPAVPRDLETIAQKCLSKEGSRRYASAAEVADDLERFLRHEPIRAKPVGAWGRLVRWARRNPSRATLTGTVAALLILVAVGASVSAARLERARRAEMAQRLEAETRLRQGERLIQFMLGDLADRLEPVGRLDLLDSTIAEVDKFYSGVPLAEMTPESERNRANALLQFADIRSIQGRFPEAVAAFEKAIAAYRDLVARHPDNLPFRFELTRAENDFAAVYLQQKDYPKAVVLLEQCLRERQELVRLAPTNSYWLSTIGATAQNLSIAERHLGHLERTGELVRMAEDAYRKWVVAEPNNANTKERLAMVCGTAGQYYSKIGKFDEAEKAYTEKMKILEDLLRQDPQHMRRTVDHALGLSLLAELDVKRDRFAAAIELWTRSIQEVDTLAGADPANREWEQYRVNQLEMRGEALQSSGQLAAALDDFRRVAEISERLPENAQAYGEWASDYRLALERTEAIRRAMAEADRKAGRAESAAQQEKLAAEAKSKLTALPAP
jgi:tetratricopeptide (TPR) repeat protein